MVTKKKSKSNFVEVHTRRRDHYHLTPSMMVAVSRVDGTPLGWGHFMPRGEMKRVIEQVYIANAQIEALAYNNDFGARRPYTARQVNGELRIGCNTFSKTQVRKLARWAGVNIASR